MPALETVLFASSPYGLVASAGIGLIWAFLRPEEKPKKQTEVRESMAKACQAAIHSAIKSENVRNAANALNGSQEWFYLYLCFGTFLSLQ